MNKKKNNWLSLPVILGTLGLIAGIALTLEGNWLIGIAGSIASAGLVYKGYQDYKALEKKEA
jgi:Kef-type K+ transport system membrane component KefB